MKKEFLSLFVFCIRKKQIHLLLAKTFPQEKGVFSYRLRGKWRKVVCVWDDTDGKHKGKQERMRDATHPYFTLKIFEGAWGSFLQKAPP
ncbi:MAG: hypothetical protein E7624_07410 [Ruminococcaceae bacterium]|nr:hypothetical protein [Oscillospiraceae bacterium]